MHCFSEKQRAVNSSVHYTAIWWSDMAGSVCLAVFWHYGVVCVSMAVWQCFYQCVAMAV